MNWDAIGALAELLSSVGVLVTLIYLATQVGHARTELRRSVRQHRSDTLRDLFLSRLSNPRLQAIYSGATTPANGVLQERLGLSGEDAFLIMQDQLAWWQYTDQVILDIEELSEGEKHQFHAGLVRRYRTDPIGAVWYGAAKQFLNHISVQYVDSMLEQTEA